MDKKQKKNKHRARQGPDPGLIPQGVVLKHQALYLKCFGQEIMVEEAYSQASDLLEFFRWVYRHMGKADYDAVDQLAASQRVQAEKDQVKSEPPATEAPDSYTKLGSGHVLDGQDGSDD